MIPKPEKMYQINIKMYQRVIKTPKGQLIFQMALKSIYQHFPIKGHQKLTQTGIFGLKIKHLAILGPMTRWTHFHQHSLPEAVKLLLPKPASRVTRFGELTPFGRFFYPGHFWKIKYLRSQKIWAAVSTKC
jgi:hypothetical protein